MLDATLILLQQSPKQLSKMLIEHTNGSIEDKPKTGECDGALRWSTRCFNQQSLNWLANQQCHTTLRTVKRSTQKSTPEKSTLSVNGQHKQQQQLGQ